MNKFITAVYQGLNGDLTFFFDNERAADRFLKGVPVPKDVKTNTLIETTLIIKYLLQGGNKITQRVVKANGFDSIDITSKARDCLNILTDVPAVRKEYLTKVNGDADNG